MQPSSILQSIRHGVAACRLSPAVYYRLLYSTLHSNSYPQPHPSNSATPLLPSSTCTDPCKHTSVDGHPSLLSLLHPLAASLPTPHKRSSHGWFTLQRTIPAHLQLTIQTSIGTGYDLSNSVFSPDGRNFQVEYAVKAVENGGTAVGIRCKDGVVLALEKLVTSKLVKKESNKKIATVDRNIGIVSLMIRRVDVDPG